MEVPLRVDSTPYFEESSSYFEPVNADDSVLYLLVIDFSALYLLPIASVSYLDPISYLDPVVSYLDPILSYFDPVNAESVLYLLVRDFSVLYLLVRGKSLSYFPEIDDSIP